MVSAKFIVSVPKPSARPTFELGQKTFLYNRSAKPTNFENTSRWQILQWSASE